MKEAFSRAELKAEEQNPNGSQFAVTILRREYRNLGNNYFNTVIAPNYIRGRKIRVPVFEHLQEECVSLHPRLVRRLIPERANILEGLTEGMRISELSIDPAYNTYLSGFEEEGGADLFSDSPYSRPATLFLYGISLLYVETAKQSDLWGFMRGHFINRFWRNFIPLPYVRLAVATWLDGVNISNLRTH